MKKLGILNVIAGFLITLYIFIIDLEILEMVGLDVDIRGFGLDIIDAIVSDAVSAAGNIFREIVYEQVEGPVLSALNNEIGKIKLPFG